MVATMTITGGKQVVQAINQFEKRVRKRVMRKAVNAGANPLVKTSRQMAPVGNGTLKRSLTKVIRSYKSGATIMAIIGQDKRVQAKSIKHKGGISGSGKVVPLHLVENSTNPHMIKGPVAIRTPGGRVVVVQNIKHPGTTGQHFVAKAARASEQAAVGKFTAKLTAEVNREAAAAAVSS